MNYLSYFLRQRRLWIICAVISFVILCAALFVWTNAARLSHVGKSQSIPTGQVDVAANNKQSDMLVATLPDTNSDIAELLHREADNASITIEEISYESRLEHDLPIELRNASFGLTNNYTTIRHYLDSVIHAQTNLTLDTLDCTRDDISSKEVNCVVTISALQRYNPGPAGNAHVN